MNSSPFDPARRAAVREMLVETVEASAPAAGRPPRRRLVRSVSVTAAVVLMVVGGSVALAAFGPSPRVGTAGPVATTHPQQSTGPVVVAPPENTTPAIIEPAMGNVPVTPLPTYDPSATNTWEVSFTGIGHLTIGHSQQADSVGMDAWTKVAVAGCPVVVFKDDAFGPDFSTSSTTGTSGITSSVRVGDGFDASEDPQDLAALSPRTDRGIRLGSSLAELRAAYPSAVLAGTGPNPEGTTEPYWSVSGGTGHWIDFSIGTDSLVSTIVVSSVPLPAAESCR